jgi:hypothetical protein
MEWLIFSRLDADGVALDRSALKKCKDGIVLLPGRVHLVLFPILFCLFALGQASAQFTQQGSKLVGTDPTYYYQGGSVSLSSDGNTAIIGGGGTDIAWVWTRSGGVWRQQGSKLVGTGAVSGSLGDVVSLSSDGNTAIVGASGDNNMNVGTYEAVGAVWMWTRSGGVWTQQGSKLVGTGAVGGANQGSSASLSSDGNTAIVGGSGDNSYKGAAWVWTRSGGVWTQQGSKLVLVGTGAVGGANQGASVSLSSDGNTAIVGGYGDNSYKGAAWVWTRSGGVWTQQGSKLVGTGAVGGSVYQGGSVSLSSDGNKAIVGGDGDSPWGAAWVWTRSGGVWTQQGSKLVGTGGDDGNNSGVYQGASVSLSSDGNTAIVGGPNANSLTGAAWIYVTPNAPLPVELSSFIATSKLSTAELQWKTVTEVNNTGFDIERRDPYPTLPLAGGGQGKGWTKIGSVAGAGTSNAPHNYSYTDNVGSAGTYSYRLKQIDHDGAFVYSQAVQVTIAVAKVLALSQNYPEPFNPSTTIQFTVPNDGRATLKVYNAIGQEVATLFNDDAAAGVIHQVQFNGSNLASGMYFSRLEFGGKMQMKKMLLLK